MTMVTEYPRCGNKPFKETIRTLSILILSSSCGKNMKSLKYSKSTLLYSIKGRETEAEG